jgi:hypothetical protein
MQEPHGVTSQETAYLEENRVVQTIKSSEGRDEPHMQHASILVRLQAGKAIPVTGRSGPGGCFLLGTKAICIYKLKPSL